MKKYIGISIITLSLGLTSCNDFLDKMPDNRTEANTTDKIEKLLVSAYPTHDHMAVTEYASDNVDNMGDKNPNTDRFIDQLYAWDEVTESDNQDPESYWMDLYQCIETANMALEGIEAAGGATTVELREAQAEALLCRAYAHFMLVNVFAPHYKSSDATSLGVSYVTETEKELNPQYERETVQENYAHIEADIEAALPNVGDSYYTVPKYHFNKNAAYAFASRFYLYYEKYDKAIEAANKVLGANPSAMLRDWAYLNSLPNGAKYEQDPTTLHVIDATMNCNLLLLTSYSYQGIFFGGFSTGHKYSHNSYLGEYETITPVAKLCGGSSYSSLKMPPKRYSGSNMDAWSQWRFPYLFEYVDPVAGVGYPHTVYSAFTGDEVLLNRAEAYIMLNQYDKACEDMTTWACNVCKNAKEITVSSVKAYMSELAYAYDSSDGTPKAGVASSPKKHLNPSFTISEEGSEQESLIQAVLMMRRYETLHEGKRWFDVKRWGIEIPRRMMNSGAKPEKIVDWLTVDDPRRAVQIPQKVYEAGYTPNPRSKIDDSSEYYIPVTKD